MRRLYYWLENGMLRGIKVQLSFVLLVIIGISLIAGGIVYLGQEIDSYWDAVWWAFLRLSDPGYLGEDNGLALRAISLVVTILGSVLFLGALVAILTSWMNRSIAQMQQGRSPVVERKHFVILGWSKDVPAIVREFALSQERVRLRIGSRQPRVVLLLPEMAPRYLQLVEAALRGLAGRLKVVYRAGSPLIADDLRRVAVEKATTVILVASGETKDDRAVADTRTVKSLLTLSRLQETTARTEGFSGVAELTYSLNADLVHEAAKSSRIEILASDRLLSQVIAQSLRRPGAASVFMELFTQGKGQQVFLVTVPAGWGGDIPFRSTYSFLTHGLPIGVKRSRERGGQIVLNPDPNFPVQSGDELIVLAETLREARRTVRRPSIPQPTHPTASARLALTTQPSHRVLILNWNSRVTAILRELDTYESERFDVTIVSSRPTELIRQALDRYTPNLSRVRLDLHQGDPVFPGDLADLDFKSFNSVLFVASDRIHDAESSDARTLMSFLRLKEHFRQGQRDPSVLVEVLDPLNESFFRLGERVSVLISQDIVSHSLAQIALRPDLNAIYDELTSAGGAEIDFVPATLLFSEASLVSFERVVAQASLESTVAIGVRHQGEVHLNPPRQSMWMCDASLEIVVIASH